ncbi:hypothetical protein BCR33DRAFT_844780 [Rhizoclosmatium globosum]|uniref:FAD/NAD(P)-binding domain-containing protein n=1 Tax=Rhizoclosmatium globosum TaxID=329046 RepID=A0A1Y2D2W6_9FUNG|nr:hypothetical protein BCR33DRAFT_844780 [Rhizoclosmatium globosum]|eukprot:ORY53456.1 hypothetical protein BCR33DRAFT_844780 [Rhizoclosmatium globosum]
MSVPTIVIVGDRSLETLSLKDLTRPQDEGKHHFDRRTRRLYFQIAGLRAAVEPNYAQHTWIPYSNLFQHNNNSKVIQARAESVTDKEVKLSNGQTIAFDYIVIATGLSQSAPGGTSFVSKDEYVKEMEKVQKAVEKAESVVIVGGGVVGVELAGEIATDFPSKKVTIIHSASVLMDKLYPTASTTKEINSQLSALGVQVLLNTRATPLPGAKTLLPDGKPYHLGHHKITTTTNETIQSDIQFLCTGSAHPNTSFLTKPLPDSLDTHGFVSVKPTGQFKAHPHMYALGDVSTLDDLKLAYLAFSNQAPKAVPGGFFVATIGRFGGVLQTPIGTFGKWAARMVKSNGLFLDKYWKEMRQPYVYKTPEHLLVNQRESGSGGVVGWGIVATVLAAAAAVGLYVKNQEN